MKRNFMLFVRALMLCLVAIFVGLKSFAQTRDFKRVDTDTAVDQQALLNADKFSTKDSAMVLEEYGKSDFQNRRIYLWGRNIHQKDNVAAISTIYSQDINSTPVRDITNVMAGRLAGLYTLQLSGQTGNDGSSFSVRGQTPIIVVDGVVRNFTNFNPNDIKSITVLKDAVSTAMYGLRSSNGVINIVTKDMGESNFELSASAQYGVSTPTKTPQFLGAYDYGRLYNEAQLNSNPSAKPVFGDSLLNAYKNGTNNPFLSPNVNWYNQVLKSNTNMQRYSVSVGGYGKSYHYFASLENFNQSGNFVTSAANTYNTNNDYKRYNVRLNATIDFNKNISLALNLFGSVVNTGEPGFGATNIVSYAYYTPPTAYPIFNPDSSYGAANGSTYYKYNPYAATLSSGYSLYNERTLNEDVKLTYRLDGLTKGLWASAAVSFNEFYREQINRSKAFATYQYTPGVGTAAATYTKYNSNGTVGSGSYTLSNQYGQNYYNLLMGYDKGWSKNTIHLLGTFNADNLINSTPQINQVYQTAGLTANYDWNKKYYADMALAYSGLNYYPPGKRWAFLPSLGLGWVISNENFYHSNTIDFLKLRASVGQTAAGYPGYFSYLQGYALGTTGYNVGTTATAVSGVTENGVSNPNITWEKAWKWDAGLEMALLNNKLNISLDYYYNKYYDQLITPANTSSVFGQSYPQLNLGKTNYYGAEASIGYNNKVGQFNYFIKGNVSIAQSKVVNAEEPNYPYAWMYKKGLPTNTTFGYISSGLYQQTDDLVNAPHIAGYTPVAGDIKYKDLNGDGTINFLDVQNITKISPLVFFGINGGITFKGLDFSFLIQGVENRNTYISPSSITIQEFYGGFGNVQSFHLNRWTPATASTATYPRLTVGGNPNNTVASSFWMRDGSYLRLKNIELGYSFPTKWLGKAKIRQVRLFVNAYNLATWSKLKDFNIDPESSTGYYANNRVINSGISIKL